MFNFSTFAGMEKIYGYYTENIRAYSLIVEGLKKRIHMMGSIRLGIFVAALITLWFLRDKDWEVLTGIMLLYSLPFIALMIYHNKLQNRKNYAEGIILLNRNELNALDYDFSAFDGAPEKSSAEHSFSLDLDLFGNNSLFQSINRTVTTLGKEELVDWFQEPLTDKALILNRAEAVKELSELTTLRQHFYVTGFLKPGDKKDPHLLTDLVSGKKTFTNNIVWKSLIWVIPAIWVILIVCTSLHLIPSFFLGIYLGISFIVSYLPAQAINKLYNKVNKMEKIFSVYSRLMKCIEGQAFQSDELNNISAQLINSGGMTASQSIRKLSGYIGGLDQRFSAAGLILNMLYLRDTRHAMHLERWIDTHHNNVSVWLNALSRFDAYCSLGSFAFNHPDYIYPEIAETYFVMKGDDLGHPLLNRNVCIRNNIDIKKNPFFLIITGANMAGKSTYLRTVGVNYLLACIGAPVFASSLTVYPAQLVTSLRTSDSLVSNESYFFAELKRLKMIIDRLKEGEEMFIILDEILKGTNSVDKQKGSIALMKQLIRYKTCGIIATHDLVLGTLEEEFPDEIKNYRFEADIENDELSFSYLLREGIAQNMNAYFLMKKMGITV